MKISKDRLKEIIKEELELSKEPAEHSEFEGEYEADPDGYEGRMAKGNLYKIIEYATELHDLIADNENLEPWVEEKIAVAAYMMDSVGHYLQYEKHRGHEDAEGHEGHADLSPAEREREEMAGGEEGEEEMYMMEETEFEGSEE